MTEYDVYLFKEGKHCRLYEKMGSHLTTLDGLDGVQFGVWAPSAKSVSVIGGFNGWRPGAHQLNLHDDGSGIWEGFLPGVAKGSLYKYHVQSKYGGYSVDKGDPFANFWEVPPRTASIVWDLGHNWAEGGWKSKRKRLNSLDSPLSIYEVHLGSWTRVPEDRNRPLTYEEAALELPDYARSNGFSHVEFLPLMEHPFYGSWGYQTTGYFAPTSRYGTPQGLMSLIERLHEREIGVILDWVPSHFPTDEYALGYFDGTHLYEYADHRKGFSPEWGSYVFDYGKKEVWSFLVSSAIFWLDKYRADGIRVDATSSMLYLDYSRRFGEWEPNVHGGRENLEAVAFLRYLNEAVYGNYPEAQMVAEESTAWPMVTRPTTVGGLGFGMKWNMGWMHDTLAYFSREPVHRRFHQDQLTFSLWYAFSENYILPLSHDEVVHGKGSLLGKMPGDVWQKFANLRLLLGYMYGHPGKKLLFMGGEFGQWSEWNHDQSLDWHLLKEGANSGVQKWVRDLNLLHSSEASLHGRDFEPSGFEWVDFTDAEASVVSFLRRGKGSADPVLVACNFTPVPRFEYKVGVPKGGKWRELLNSDATVYGGSGKGNLGSLSSSHSPSHGRPFSLSLTMPPLSILFLKPDSEKTNSA
jgi:1,4-alpha-glucan branching enzyme